MADLEAPLKGLNVAAVSNREREALKKVFSALLTKLWKDLALQRHFKSEAHLDILCHIFLYIQITVL